MAGSRIVVRLLVAGLSVLPVLTVPVLAGQASAAAPDGYTSWSTREDGRTGASDRLFSWSGDQGPVFTSTFGSGIWMDATGADGMTTSVTFQPPLGQTLHAGATYRTQAWPEQPTATLGRLVAARDGETCGRTNAAYAWNPRHPANPATGTFHVRELQYDESGAVARFAATYELSCQFTDGPRGVEGSVAVSASEPAAPLPAAPPVPVLTGLRSSVVGPDGSGNNVTTLSWGSSPGTQDVTIDMVQSSDAAVLPAGIGQWGTRQYVGPASSWRATGVEFMDTRTYRVVPRGPSGRLGDPATITVRGTRLSLPDTSDRVQIGQYAEFTGRLSEAWHPVDPADVMRGPGLVGRTVLLCRQSSTRYVDGACEAVARTTTTAGGYFTLAVRPQENSYYSVTVPGSGQVLGNTSRVVSTAYVSPQTDLAAPEAERSSARSTARRGRPIHFTTSRSRAGSTGVLRLQRLDGRTWHTLATKRIAKRGGARMAIPYRERLPGLHQYRVVKLGDSHHVHGYSRVLRVRVG